MPSTEHSQSCPDNAARLLAEGVQPLVDAAKEAGLRPVPSLRTLLRASISRRLESVKVAGRRLTSAPAIVRWVSRQQGDRCEFRRDTIPHAAASVVLESYGLGPGASA